MIIDKSLVKPPTQGDAERERMIGLFAAYLERQQQRALKEYYESVWGVPGEPGDSVKPDVVVSAREEWE